MSHENQNYISDEMQRNPQNFCSFLNAVNTAVEILPSQLAGEWTYRIFASELTECSQESSSYIRKCTYRIFANKRTEYSQV